LFDDGATIVLQALHRYWTPLSLFCRDLENVLTHPVQVNVYLTPPVSQGLDIHYDTHDVFVLQVAGVKHWKVWHEAYQVPLAHQRRSGSYEDPGDATIDAELKPGDALYIPRGFLHAAQTLDRESAHMTIGVLNVTQMDLLRKVMERAENDARFRRSLPPGFAHDPSAMEDHVRELLGTFSEWASQQDASTLARETASKFWSARPPILTGQLQQLLALDDLSDASTIRKRPGTVCVVSVDDDELTLNLGDRVLMLPAYVAPAIGFVTEAPSFPVAALGPYLDEQGRLVLVKRLIREGLLEHVPGG
jgi:hypothetical protein